MSDTHYGVGAFYHPPLAPSDERRTVCGLMCKDNSIGGPTIWAVVFQDEMHRRAVVVTCTACILLQFLETQDEDE